MFLDFESATAMKNCPALFTAGFSPPGTGINPEVFSFAARFARLAGRD
jgi:hypothetical protein